MIENDEIRKNEIKEYSNRSKPKRNFINGLEGSIKNLSSESETCISPMARWEEIKMRDRKFILKRFLFRI